MMGIAGWVGGHTHDVPPEVILKNMATGLDLVNPHPEGLGEALSSAGIVALKSAGNVWCAGPVMCSIDGEPIWNDAALQDTANSLGHAKAFADGYKLYGEAVFERLHGAFSVAIINRESGEATIAIDRMGIHGLVYGQGPNGLFCFGTTTDAVKCHPDMASTISNQAIYNYLFNYIVSSPGTIYREQSKLLPAQLVHFKAGRITTRFYWEMPYSLARSGDMEEWKERLWGCLDKNFSKYVEGCDAGNEVGAFLSGGLDSSTVAGLLSRQREHAKTFTIGFREPEYDESAYARLVAEHFRTDHHEYFVTPDDVVSLMPKIAEVYDEPYGNTSAVPAFYCARAARDNGVSTLLAGDGGDEIFAGNERYAYMKRIESYGHIPGWIRSGIMEPLTKLPGLGVVPPVRKARRLAERFATPMPERIYAHNFLADGTPGDVLSADVLDDINVNEPMDILREAYLRPKSVTMLQRMMHLDLKITLADNDLRKVNKMCQLAGVKVRYPLLDDELVAFAASIPSSLLLPGMKLRHFYKQSMKDFLPDEVLKKEKHGFGLPFNVWIKQDANLQSLILDRISDFRRHGYLRNDFLDRLISDCQKSTASPTDGMAWDIAMLDMWIEKHTEQKSQGNLLKNRQKG